MLGKPLPCCMVVCSESLPVLEKEYRFWQEQRAINVSVGGEVYSLNHYSVPVGEPR